MGAFSGKDRVSFGEGGLDEQEIGATDEFDDRLPIGGVSAASVTYPIF